MKHSKTVVTIVVISLVLLGLGMYYAAALGNSDNRPENVETQSGIFILPPR